MSILKKFSFSYVKQHPVMFGSIVVVFGLLFWLLLNKNAASTQTVTESGPTDAQVAAQTQLALAGLGAQTQVTMGQLSLAAASQQIEGQKEIAAMQLQYQLADLAASHDLGTQQIQASLAALNLQLNNNLQVTNSNNSFMLNYAKQASDAATEQTLINAQLQRDLSADQLDAFKFGTQAQLDLSKFATAANIISTLKSGKRDNAFSVLIGDTFGGGLTPAETTALMQPNGSTSGGGSFFGDIIHVVSPLTNLA